MGFVFIHLRRKTPSLQGGDIRRRTNMVRRSLTGKDQQTIIYDKLRSWFNLLNKSPLIFGMPVAFFKYKLANLGAGI
jgi:hypothetical protein